MTCPISFELDKALITLHRTMICILFLGSADMMLEGHGYWCLGILQVGRTHLLVLLITRLRSRGCSLLHVR
jgi:hypothetical protein